MVTQLVEVDAETFDEANAQMYELGWLDGLPAIPPTPERVRALLSRFDYAPDTVVGQIPPSNVELTFEKIVINCVMAGCDAEHVPVVLAATTALSDLSFNLSGVQGTTGPHAPLCVVNGPIRGDLGINSGRNCFGQGTRSNAVIGRAIRLILQNVGRGLPGVGDMATMGHPGKYAFCVGENEEASPWSSLADDRGVSPGTSAVTMIACDSPRVIVDNTSTTAEGIIRTITGSLKGAVGAMHYYMFGRNMQLGLVLGPEHAKELAQAGWSKADLHARIYAECRIERRDLQDCGMYWNRTWPDEVEALDEHGKVPIVLRPENVLTLVAGGPGRVSAWLPTWHTTQAVTQEVGPGPRSVAADG